MAKKVTQESTEEVIAFESDKQRKQEIKLEKKRVKKEQRQIRKDQEAEFKSNNKFVHTVKNKVWPVLIPFVLVMICLVILPLLSIIFMAIFKQTGDASFPAKLDFSAWADVFSGGTGAALGLSIAYALVTSILCVIIGYPIAYMMATMKSKILAQNMWVLVTMPMWISMILKTLGLQSFFTLMGGVKFIGTPICIIVGMIYMFLPFAIGPMYDSIIARQTDLEEAAKDLGCSGWKTFWTITMRQTMPGVLTGFSLVIVQASTSLIAVHYLGNNKALVASIIESYFIRGNNFQYGAIISVVLTALIFLLMWIISLISKKFENRGKGKYKWRNSSEAHISQ